jgi:amino acid adenylation domain-containing protein/thioester reductase-like protein
MSDTSQRIADLSPEKRLLLLQKLAKEKAARARIQPRPRIDPIPPSFAQQRLWLLDQLEPGSPAYNVPAGAWMRGTPDLDVLRRCLEELVQRHEALRTTIPATDGRPRQAIAGSIPIDLPLHDVSQLPEGERRTAALAIAHTEATTPFDLARGPLMRARVVRLSDNEHLLVLNFHHVAIDGWSFSTFYRELGALYEAFVGGRPSPLPELQLQYADFAMWQREWLQGDALKSQLDYWTARIAGSPAVLELPGDHPRPAVQSHGGGVVRLDVPADVVEAAKKVSRDEGTTLFMTILAALKIVLFRYSGQTDLVVGSGIAGRIREELEPLVGYFVNTLALRTDLSGDPTFRELLVRTRDVTLGAYEHQDLPVERLIEELNIERSLSHTPLFQVMIFFQNLPAQVLVLPGLTLVPLTQDEINTATARCDLSLFIEPDGEEMRIFFEYSTDLFEAETIRALGGHMVNLLRAAAAQPGTRIGMLPMLGEEERHELLVTRTATRKELPANLTLTSLVEQQVARTPDAPAIIVGDRTLTYRELSARANTFAAELRQRGAKPGEIVGIYTERGAEMIVAVLGILRTGAAYLPLDPTYPVERLGFMLEDTGACLVVTQQHLRGEVPSAESVELVLLDATGPSDQDAPPVDGGPSPADTAYIIFTSGSTGRPKGVQIPHVGAANFLLAMLHEPGLNADDVVAAITTLSFDISVLELLLPLITGARAVIGDRATAIDGKRLARFVAGNGVTVLQATPASWRMLLDAGWEGVPGLKILCGGEPLPRDLADRLLDRVGELWNVYGPTETTVWSVLDRVLPGEPITIGRPIQNMCMYVVDTNLQPVPDGVPGELVIGGIGVGHGYIRRPDLTADRFIVDPFSGVPGARIYRSGDIARWRRDGRLEILGRADNQVKLRGFRIELGEIEGVLREQPAVRQAVVLLREDRPGDKRLVAYVVPHDAPPSAKELRASLNAVLPEYMVPSAFVIMEKMPISPNGKVDRRALPAPAVSEAQQTESVAPRTPEEQQLAAIWADVLGVPALGVDDDFFALGGHSLLATQMIARVATIFGIDIPLRRLFDARTVASFAQLIVSEMTRWLEGLGEEELGLADRPAQGSPEQRAARIPTRPAGEDSLALSPAQLRMWFLEQLQPGTGSYHSYDFQRLSGPVDADALAAAYRAIVRRHESLRTSFVAEEGVPRQLIAADVPFDVQRIDLRGAAHVEAAAQKLADDEALHPFDLSRAPLLRVTLARLGEDDHLLLITLHHIVSDGWSLGVLDREFLALYEGAPLPDLPLQYGDVVRWLAQPEQEAHLAKQAEWWKERLAGVPDVLDLPADHVRPTVQSFKGGRFIYTLQPDFLAELQELAQREGVTLFMVLSAAFQTLLYRHTGQGEFAVGTPVANRTPPETEPLIGLFINTVTLRAALDGDPAFRELLLRVREDVLDAFAHQEVPFDRVVDALGSARSANRTPLFQTMIVLGATQGSYPTLRGGVTRQVFQTHSAPARFDLTLSMSVDDTGLTCVFDYAAELFDPATIEDIAHRYASLLRGAAADPDTPVSRLPLVDAAEMERLLHAFNRTRAERPEGATLHGLFSDQAARTPDAVAIVAPGQTVTYAELDRWSDAIAARVHGPITAFLADRSPAAIAAVMGILKAGAAYLPIDPGVPAERVQWLLDDAGAELLDLEALGVGRQASGISGLDDTATSVARDPEVSGSATPPRSLTPDASSTSLAYVIYTSGSTGAPKGVMVEHRSAVNLALSFAESHGFAGHRLLMIPPLPFDASVGDVFPALATGAALVLHPSPADLDARELARYCAEHRVTAIDAPAALWRRWTAEWADIPALTLMMVGGESVPVAEVRRFAQLTDGRVQFVNHYGPTEATVCATTYHTIDAAEVAATELPIGTPIANVTAYVLDRHLAPLPAGVAGELYLGGIGVSRGYLGRPQETAERFIDDPFSREPGSRLYRTGDLVRRRADGVLLFLGRADRQIKLRGFRIEPAEIEAALLSRPAVRAAIVVKREERLVAYVVSDEQDAHETLRPFLQDRLPDYMVPAAIVVLDALPLTSNGKVDLNALPAPPVVSSESRAPRNEIERELVTIWRDVLGTDRAGVDDDFFALGGDSLRTMPLIHRIRERFGIDLPLSSVFRAPTVARFAALIAGAPRGEDSLESKVGSAPPIEAAVDATLPPRNVMLTGATGFLGAFLVDELRRATSATIYALVRAADEQDALRRIGKNLRGYGLDPDTSRIVPLLGDLAEPRLGLDEAAFAHLAETVDVIYHNGGVVNFVAPYASLEAANVSGTREVLRLAGLTKVKPVHLVSTLGVHFTMPRIGSVVRESDPLPPGADILGGYNQTKWVADRVGLLAREAGLPVSVHRPARITGDSRTGALNAGDLFYSWIAGCVQLGLFPGDTPMLNMAPVDHIARSVVALSLEAAPADYHYFNNRMLPLETLTAELSRRGFPVEIVPFATWLAALRQAPENPLSRYLALMEPDEGEPIFDCTATEERLAAMGIVCPPADAALLGKYLDVLLSRPDGEGAPAGFTGASAVRSA